MTGCDVLQAIDAAHLNDHLPIGVLVVDEIGTIRHLNHRASALTGYGLDEAVGRSIVAFVDEGDLTFLMESLSAAGSYAGEVMGPLRIRYRHRDGSARWTELWAFQCPESFGFVGYIVTLATESVTDNLAHAALQIASDRPLTEALETVARAVSGFPLVATGSVLLPGVGAGEPLGVIGPWPFGERSHVDDVDMPWHRTLLTGESVDLDLTALPESIRRDAVAKGYRSVWVRGVVTQGANVAGAFVAWRHEPGGASPNQERHLAEVVGVARLAFDHDEHRAELERAALADHLTGLGNRALLARQLAASTDRRVAVLYIDLDEFKSVNDTHGHDVGDMVLSAAARRLRTVVRDDDQVFRIGGDEFVVLCDGLVADDDAATLAEIADRIVHALGSPFRIGATTVVTGASVGIATREPNDTTADVIRRADQALLHAKRDGKARWRTAPNRIA